MTESSRCSPARGPAHGSPNGPPAKRMKTDPQDAAATLAAAMSSAAPAAQLSGATTTSTGGTSTTTAKLPADTSREVIGYDDLVVDADAAREQKVDMEEAIFNISNADAVAMDFEFTGLFGPGQERKRYKDFHEYFSCCVDGAQLFAPVEIGISCYNRKKISSKEKDAASEDLIQTTQYSWMILPDRLFSMSRSSCQFLRRAVNFDFNRLLDQGDVVTRKACFEGMARSSDVEKIIHALIYRPKAVHKNRKTKLVFHHGIFDILHFYHTFLGDLMVVETVKQFQQKWSALVGDKIEVFDTRYLMQKVRNDIGFQERSLGLQAIYNWAAGPEGLKVDAHRAADDAYMTAVIFAKIVDEYSEIEEKKKAVLGGGVVAADKNDGEDEKKEDNSPSPQRLMSDPPVAGEASAGGPANSGTVPSKFSQKIDKYLAPFVNCIAGYGASPQYFSCQTSH